MPMILRLNIAFLLFFVCTIACFAQSQPNADKRRWFDTKDDFHHNRLYFYWGYNREIFSKTDIHFHGKGYDFTIYGATAHNRPTPFTFNDYANPGRITIPQYNFHVGYYLKHNI